jgi:hypothetical protein
VDLHPYDNVERRFRHTDPAREKGRRIVARLLRLPEPPKGDLLFDLSFFSSGIGVIDRLAITRPADPGLWSRVVDSLRARTPEEARAFGAWAAELVWLLTSEEAEAPIRPAAVSFINQNRREFQAECVPSNRILFRHESDVNSWTILWGDDNRLNYLGYDQG